MILKKYDELPVFMKNDDVKKYYDILQKKKTSIVLKRFFDIIMALVILILLSPIMLILAICIKIDSKGPVFYRQERITQYGKKFKIFKFRTMVQDADKKGSLVTVHNDSRITRVGKLIRKLRLDEFPQLLNVITGDMSFVGTRPEVKKYVDNYTDEMKATLLMKAGVTSNTSIHFKDEDKIIEKLKDSGKEIDDIYVEDVLPIKMKYNFEYIKNFDFFGDIKICIDTVLTVLGLGKNNELKIINLDNTNEKEKIKVKE